MSVLPGVMSPQPALTTEEASKALLQSRRPGFRERPDGDGYADAGHDASKPRYLDALLGISGVFMRQLASAGLVAAYFDRPRITVVSSSVSSEGTQGSTLLSFEADLVSDSPRIIGSPGQATSALPPFRTALGILENVIESNLFPTQSPSSALQLQSQISTTAVFAAAANQGIPLIFINSADPEILQTLALSSVAKARISTALQAGDDVIVPEQEVTIGGEQTVAWFQVDPRTGATTGVGEDGAHTSESEYVTTLGVVGSYASIIGLVGLAASLIPVFGSNAAKDVWNALVAQYDLDLLSYYPTFSNGPNMHAVAKAVAKENLETSVHQAEDDMNNNELGDRLGYSLAFFNTMESLLTSFERKIPKDPPLPQALLGLPGSLIHGGSEQVAVTATMNPGTVNGGTAALTLSVDGAIQASWNRGASSGFSVNTLRAAVANVQNAGAPRWERGRSGCPRPTGK